MVFLNKNKISDEGAKALAEALKVNTALQELDLIGNEISDAVEQQIKTDVRIEYGSDGDGPRLGGVVTPRSRSASPQPQQSETG